MPDQILYSITTWLMKLMMIVKFLQTIWEFQIRKLGKGSNVLV